jgi:hypothetical protein
MTLITFGLLRLTSKHTASSRLGESTPPVLPQPPYPSRGVVMPWTSAQFNQGVSMTDVDPEEEVPDEEAAEEDEEVD